MENTIQQDRYHFCALGVMATIILVIVNIKLFLLYGLLYCFCYLLLFVLTIIV